MEKQKIPKINKEKRQNKLSISIDQEIDKILEDLNFNKSKLINKLLRNYISNKNNK